MAAWRTPVMTRTPRAPDRAPGLSQRRGIEVLFDDLIALAAEGRLTIAALREIAARLRNFFACLAVEILWREKGRCFHACAHQADTSCWREKKDVSFPGTLEALETVAPEVRRGLEAGLASRRRRRIPRVISVPSGPPAAASGGRRRAPRATGLVLSAGRDVAGIAVLSFAGSPVERTLAPGRLERLARLLGIALVHNLSRFDLRERIKELSCMYRLAGLAVEHAASEERFLQQTVALLPEAYQYPEIACARIVLGERVFQTGPFHEGFWIQQAPIRAGDQTCGRLEVAYREARPELDEGPFLLEERRLIESAAREIGLFLERRRAEREQSQLREQLFRAERLATIGTLAAGVAHELNEPLTGILGFAELLQESPGWNDEAAGDLRRITTAALHAREIVRKLLLFARQVSPRPGRVDLNGLVREVVEFLEYRVRQSSVAIRLRLDPTLPAIPADEAQLRQVLINLCLNAIQAMSGGGQLMLATRALGAQVRLTVRDTGPGIPEAIRDKIFLPFFTTKPVGQGTGLGLAVVHGIVNAHRGEIRLVSRPHGAEFRVTLPVSAFDA